MADDIVSSEKSSRGTQQAVQTNEPGVSVDRRGAERIERIRNYCMPDEMNVKGPERGGRVVLGVAIGAFGMIGVVTAEQPVLGLSLGILLLILTAYLLVTAKTKKCPVKHVAQKQMH